MIVLDGTMSSLEAGQETNAGLAYKLFREAARSQRMAVHYEAGIQWQEWRRTLDVIEGRGINRQIQRVYGYLASRYHPGDQIFIFGYSRGAYAARAMAGMIERVGLVRSDQATTRAIRQAYRHYQAGGDSTAARLFSQQTCHTGVAIRMIGAWDTVKALGLRFPILWRYSTVEHRFHNLQVSTSVECARHALALDETREAFAPVMWESRSDGVGDLVQMWFRGSHGDVGGQLGGYEPARALSDIPLVWMLKEAELAGLKLPDGWTARFPTDPAGPSVGTIRGWGKLFWFRRRRVVGADPSEMLHDSVPVADAPSVFRPIS